MEFKSQLSRSTSLTAPSLRRGASESTQVRSRSSFPRPWWLRKLVGSSAFSNSLGRAIDRAQRIQGGLMRPLAPRERVLDADHFAALKLREDNAEWLSSPTTGCLDDGRVDSDPRPGHAVALVRRHPFTNLDLRTTPFGPAVVSLLDV